MSSVSNGETGPNFVLLIPLIEFGWSFSGEFVLMSSDFAPQVPAYTRLPHSFLMCTLFLCFDGLYPACHITDGASSTGYYRFHNWTN